MLLLLACNDFQIALLLLVVSVIIEGVEHTLFILLQFNHFRLVVSLWSWGYAFKFTARDQLRVKVVFQAFFFLPYFFAGCFVVDSRNFSLFPRNFGLVTAFCSHRRGVFQACVNQRFLIVLVELLHFLFVLLPAIILVVFGPLLVLHNFLLFATQLLFLVTLVLVHNLDLLLEKLLVFEQNAASVLGLLLSFLLAHFHFVANNGAPNRVLLHINVRFASPSRGNWSTIGNLVFFALGIWSKSWEISRNAITHWRKQIWMWVLSHLSRNPSWGDRSDCALSTWRDFWQTNIVVFSPCFWPLSLYLSLILIFLKSCVFV